MEVYYEVPGSRPKTVNGNGKKVYTKKVEFFAWEKLDYVDKIRKAFNCNWLSPLTLIFLTLPPSPSLKTTGREGGKHKKLRSLFSLTAEPGRGPDHG